MTSNAEMREAMAMGRWAIFAMAAASTALLVAGAFLVQVAHPTLPLVLGTILSLTLGAVAGTIAVSAAWHGPQSHRQHSSIDPAA